MQSVFIKSNSLIRFLFNIYFIYCFSYNIVFIFLKQIIATQPKTQPPHPFNKPYSQNATFYTKKGQYSATNASRAHGKDVFAKISCFNSCLNASRDCVKDERANANASRA